MLDKGHYVFMDNYYTSEQKKFLTEKFQQGERSGGKSDPASVARSMMSAVDPQEKRMFSGEEFLTASQVAGFFPGLRQRGLSLTMMILKRRLNVPPRRQPSKN